MIELIKYVVGTFAEDSSKVNYIVTEENNEVSVKVVLQSSDMGKVIGHQGKLAKALRTLVRTGGTKENKKYNIEIIEDGEQI